MSIDNLQHRVNKARDYYNMNQNFAHIVPPSSLVLSVTTAAPAQTKMKTSANCGPPSCSSLPSGNT